LSPAEVNKPIWTTNSSSLLSLLSFHPLIQCYWLFLETQNWLIGLKRLQDIFLEEGYSRISISSNFIINVIFYAPIYYFHIQIHSHGSPSSMHQLWLLCLIWKLRLTWDIKYNSEKNGCKVNIWVNYKTFFIIIF